ncbi:MAG TPA: S9 family peptidase [Ktedonobacteraceae bacterium]|nr:S9 family peptidase [Ktedonobacteraceae bacterium]
MTTPKIAPYGSWKSPITPELILSGAVRPGLITLDGEVTYWTEGRPGEGGRSVLVRCTSDGRKVDMIPPPFNVRTRVHEYGGGDYSVSNGTIYFSNFTDQRVYRLIPGEEPQPITPAEQYRYADYVVDSHRKRLICVREDHTIEGRQAVNTLVSLATDDNPDGGEVLIFGNDFYASPRLSPDGSKLAWLTWNHPNMPWDGTELWVGTFDADGTLNKAERVAGGKDESIFQPEWSPDGVLHFISDRTGWWNLYRFRNRQIEPLCEKAAEFGLPQWVFGMSTYKCISPTRIICSYTENGSGHLASLNTETSELSPFNLPYTAIGSVRATAERAVFYAASPTQPGAIVQLNLATEEREVLLSTTNVAIDAAYFSVPEPIEFPTERGQTAFAFFYPPRNPDYGAPAGELPPLLVMSHGGPTSSTANSFNLEKQFWTSRGIAILDVNYGGSTGYGRAYRERLKGQWGIVDVDDCVNGAKYLVERGLVDGNRLAITGGSAGGYTTLCALTFRDVFKTGASYYGISDLEALLGDDHKFESRYNDGLIGPYPARRDLYRERSPIHFTERLSCPIIFLQGLEDKVVPPNQSEMMVEVLRKKKLPVAYLAFEGEGHGFRRAENIKRALEAELYFFSKVFGFELADEVEPVEIENMSS